MSPEQERERYLDAVREVDEVLTRRAVDLMGPALDGALVSEWALASSFVDTDGGNRLSLTASPSTLATHSIGLLRWAQLQVEQDLDHDG